MLCHFKVALLYKSFMLFLMFFFVCFGTLFEFTSISLGISSTVGLTCESSELSVKNGCMASSFNKSLEGILFLLMKEDNCSSLALE